jgi:hypothetical protein
MVVERRAVPKASFGFFFRHGRAGALPLPVMLGLGPSIHEFFTGSEKKLVAPLFKTAAQCAA